MPQPGVDVLLGGSHLLLDGGEVLRQGVEVLRHDLVELADGRASSASCCSLRPSRTLTRLGTKASFRASSVLSAAVDLFELFDQRAEGRFQGGFAGGRRPPSPEAAAAAGAPRRGGQLVELAVDGVELLIDAAGAAELLEHQFDLATIPGRVAAGVRLAMEQVRGDLVLGLVDQAAEVFQPLGQRRAARSPSGAGRAAGAGAVSPRGRLGERIVARAAESARCGPPGPKVQGSRGSSRAGFSSSGQGKPWQFRTEG